MKIDKNLNLVIEKSDSLHVHHALIPYSLYKQNYLLISKIATHIGINNLFITAPTTALFMLNDLTGADLDLANCTMQDIGLLDAEQVDIPFVKKAFTLVSELKRLTNVLTTESGSWQHIPLVEALQRNLINDQNFDEIMSAVIFFTVSSYSQIGLNQEKLMNAYGLRSSSLNCVELLDSLRTQIGTVATPAMT